MSKDDLSGNDIKAITTEDGLLDLRIRRKTAQNKILERMYFIRKRK